MSTELQEKKAVETKTKPKKRRGTWLLILLLILIVLLLVSCGALGSRLYDLVKRDQYTVDISLGDLPGKLELFRIAYENELGEITVRGVNTDNVVAPGTTVSYDVRLRNNDEVIIDFLMTLDAAFTTEHQIPIEFKIIDNYGNYILGSETGWASTAELNALQHKGTVHPGEIFTYHITWRWVFEVSDEQDAYDTFLGNVNGEKRPGIIVSMETQAAANPAPLRDNDHLMHLLGAGFGCCWCCYLVWFLLLVAVLLLIWIWRLRKKLSEQEETMEEYEEVLQANGLLVDGELVKTVHEEN